MSTPPEQTIHVRPALAGDAERIAELTRAVHAMHADALPHVFQPVERAPVSAADVARSIAASGPLFLVATRDGAVAGYARAELLDTPASPHKLASRTLRLHELAVSPAQRRLGVGRALLQAVRTLAAERDATGVSLMVYAFNAEARAFYAREGFAPLQELLDCGP